MSRRPNSKSFRVSGGGEGGGFTTSKISRWKLKLWDTEKYAAGVLTKDFLEDE
jgi:hypothetical protein